MAVARNLPWTWLAPIAGWAALAGAVFGGLGGAYALVLAAALVACVTAAVHHAEVIAHRVGEPFGTLVLALAVTVIEVALIVSLMVAGGPAAAALARDTILAAIMLIVNGIVGICLLVGGLRHGEQSFETRGVSSALAVLATLAVVTLILPNYTTSVAGPTYTSGQLVSVAVDSLVLYLLFVFVQTIRHRDYFLPSGPAASDGDVHAPRPAGRTTLASLALLLVSLGAVVLLGKGLTPSLEQIMQAVGAPRAVVGIVIAAIVLAPESVAAFRAARANRLQTSLNLALGSALASIALTIPAVAGVSLAFGWQLILGLDAKATVLLALSLVVATISLSTGRTTVLQGAVHLVILAVYLVTTLIP
ncbi:MAG: ionic transporter y4hA [Gammaproteobacteria bacterium]|nr:ionic transporter y4hA [Gammaproteobacteria bacterium]